MSFHKSFYVLSVTLASLAAANEYFVSNLGNDNNTGKSASAPFLTLKKLNEQNLRPSDKIWLKGGETFQGPLVIESDECGRAESLISLSSYGEGRAKIFSAEGHGVLVQNCGGISISNLEVAGEQTLGSGILFKNDLGGDTKLSAITVRDVRISGFHMIIDSPGRPPRGEDTGVGLLMRSSRGRSGYRDVFFDKIIAHGNARAGIVVESAYPEHGHANVHVTNSEAYDNRGVLGLKHHTGNGIVLAGVDGGSIQSSYAHENGRNNESEMGPVGIWAFNADSILIRGNRSLRNWTRGPSDGGGFDLDGGVTNSVIEYNYSEGNAGPGYLFAQFPGAPSFRGNIIRENTSVNDARNTNSGALLVWGEVYDSQVYNNTFVSSRSRTGFQAPAINLVEWTGSGLRITNNRFIVHDDVPVFRSWIGPLGKLHPATDLFVDQNRYLSCSGKFSAKFIDREEELTFLSLKDWRASAVGAIAKWILEPNGEIEVDEEEVRRYCEGYPSELSRDLFRKGSDIPRG